MTTIKNVLVIVIFFLIVGSITMLSATAAFDSLLNPALPTENQTNDSLSKRPAEKYPENMWSQDGYQIQMVSQNQHLIACEHLAGHEGVTCFQK